LDSEGAKAQMNIGKTNRDRMMTTAVNSLNRDAVWQHLNLQQG